MEHGIYSQKILKGLLQLQHGLMKFTPAKTIERLAEIWFSYDTMHMYVLIGGLITEI